MEAENKIARLKAKLRFTLVFAIALIVTTTGGIVTIVTAQKGISLLESKKAEYDNVFKKQAELNFQIEELFRDLNNLKTKRRNSSEHKHMQKLITKKRLLMENDIAMQAVNELANGLNSALQSLSETEREQLLQYFYEWTNVTPSEFITKIESVTKLMYDHTNINQSLQTAGAFVTLLSNMFHKMSELEYIGMVRENIIVGDESHETIS